MSPGGLGIYGYLDCDLCDPAQVLPVFSVFWRYSDNTLDDDNFDGISYFSATQRLRN